MNAQEQIHSNHMGIEEARLLQLLHINENIEEVVKKVLYMLGVKADPTKKQSGTTRDRKTIGNSWC